MYLTEQYMAMLKYANPKGSINFSKQFSVCNYFHSFHYSIFFIFYLYHTTIPFLLNRSMKHLIWRHI